MNIIIKSSYYLMSVIFLSNLLFAQAIMIDHNCTDFSKVPDSYIVSAKENLKIAYGHTSHGSQITSGMNFLSRIDGSIYKYNTGDGTLSYLENLLSGDLGNPNRTEWASKTKILLDKTSNDRNMIMWSWCGQVSTANEEDIITYLSNMNQLETDYPEVIFVYMTGHLDGSGESGNLNQRNEQIRDFCRKYDKILFDFADIESYDPEGNYFLNKRANDNCDYYEGNIKKNWADEWCIANPGICGDCSCAHSKCLNCMMKGRAFWWMLARIEGWEGPNALDIQNDIHSDKSISISPNPGSDYLLVKTYQQVSNIEILNMLGMSVKEFHVTDKTNIRIDISSLAVGIYFININGIMSKFIKI